MLKFKNALTGNLNPHRPPTAELRSICNGGDGSSGGPRPATAAVGEGCGAPEPGASAAAQPRLSKDSRDQPLQSHLSHPRRPRRHSAREFRSQMVRTCHFSSVRFSSNRAFFFFFGVRFLGFCLCRQDILGQFSMVNLELYNIVEDIKNVSKAFVVHPKNVNAENATSMF